MGSDEDWELALTPSGEPWMTWGLPYAVNEGDGAFYGPKIDFICRTPSAGPGSAAPFSWTSSCP